MRQRRAIAALLVAGGIACLLLVPALGRMASLTIQNHGVIAVPTSHLTSATDGDGHSALPGFEPVRSKQGTPAGKVVTQVDGSQVYLFRARISPGGYAIIALLETLRAALCVIVALGLWTGGPRRWQLYTLGVGLAVSFGIAIISAPAGAHWYSPGLLGIILLGAVAVWLRWALVPVEAAAEVERITRDRASRGPARRAGEATPAVIRPVSVRAGGDVGGEPVLRMAGELTVAGLSETIVVEGGRFDVMVKSCPGSGLELLACNADGDWKVLGRVSALGAATVTLAGGKHHLLLRDTRDRGAHVTVELRPAA